MVMKASCHRHGWSFGRILFLLLVFQFHGAPAFAGDAPPPDPDSRARIGRIRYGCQKFTIKPENRKNVPYHRAQEIKGELGWVNGCLSTASWELPKIRAKDHPEVIALRADLKKYEEYKKDLEAVVHEHETVHKPKADLRDKFFNRYRNEYELLRAHLHHADDDQVSTSYPSPATLAEWKEALARIHAGCTGEYKAIANDPTPDGMNKFRRADQMCKAAALGEELGRRVVVSVVKQHLQTIVKKYRDQIAALPACDGYLKIVDKDYFYEPDRLKKFIATEHTAGLKSVGVELAFPLFDSLFAEVEKARAELVAELPKHVANWKGGQHGTKTKDSFVEKAYKNANKNVKLLLLELRDKSWVVELNDRGKPKFRKKRGGVVFQLPGEAWCHDEEFAYFQDYEGKGYGKSYFEFPPDKLQHARIVSCPKN